MPNDLSLLVCGNNDATTSQDSDQDLGQILAHTRNSMDSLLDHMSWLGSQSEPRMLMFAPFLGRSLLELATTALIGRLDPLRLLVVRQVQNHLDDKHNIPWRSSIRWLGDVLPAERIADLWHEKLEYEKVSKALLGQYYDSLFWQPAVQRLRNSLSTGGVWLSELNTIEAASFVPKKQNKLKQLYSSLSKAIHHEFLKPGPAFDDLTTRKFIQDSVREVADLALVSQFIPHALSTLPPQEAIDAYNRIENMEVLK